MEERGGGEKRGMRERKYEGGKRQERSERKRAQSVAEEAERWEGCSFQKGRINEKGLRIVQPKNEENGEREGAGGREGERVGP